MITVLDLFYLIKVFGLEEMSPVYGIVNVAEADIASVLKKLPVELDPCFKGIENSVEVWNEHLEPLLQLFIEFS